MFLFVFLRKKNLFYQLALGPTWEEEWAKAYMLLLMYNLKM